MDVTLKFSVNLVKKGSMFSCVIFLVQFLYRVTEKPHAFLTWSIWNHRNRCVFDGIQPSLNRILAAVKDELHLWSLAGARGVSHLLALEPANG